MTATLVSAPVQEPQTAPADVIEVVVSLRHIQEGRPYRPGQCAVALALKDIGFDDAEIDYEAVYIGAETFGNIPDELGAWLRAFDIDKSKVAPERFLIPRKPAA